jgi:hypothetical protein
MRPTTRKEKPQILNEIIYVWKGHEEKPTNPR